MNPVLKWMMLLLVFGFGAAQAQDKHDDSANRAPPLNPIVTLTISPVSSPAYVAPATIRVQASAVDQNGLNIFVTSLYRNDVWVADYPGDSLDTTLGPLSAGNYTIRADAANENGDIGSATQTITIVAANVPPAITLTSPSNGQTFTIGATAPMAATANDSDGTIDRVEFWVDGGLAGSDSVSPYAYNWTATAGSHSVLAKAIDNATATTSTSTVTIQGIPVVPTLTVPGTSSTGSYSASWTTSSGATHYELSEQIGAGSWTVIQDTSVTSRSLSGKTDGTYGYKVRACAGTGTGNCSAYSTTGTITVTIPPPPPAVPTLTVPGTSSTGSYSASWTTSSGATHYELSEQIGAGSWTVIQDTSVTSRSLSGKTDGTYGYKVRACAGTGTGNCSAYSTTGTITVTIPPPPPVVPTLTVPGTSSTGSYSASWTTSSGATHYELSEQVGSGSWSVIQDTSATSNSLSGKASGSYSYKVRACAGTGTGNCSAYSATGTITVAIPPAVPTLMVPGTSSTGSYSASWTTSSGATHYELSEQVGAGSWTVLQDTSATSASLSGKTNGSYSYRVRACAGTGTGNCSGYSATSTITVTLPPAAPTLTVPGTSSTGSYSASWTTSSGATHYELSEQVGAGSWTVIQDTSATSNSLSGKASGSYSYKVRACAGTGTVNCSGYSATSTITVTIPPPPPPVPTLTVPSTSNTGSYTASWTTSSGTTHYEFSEQVGSGSWSVIQDTSATSRSLSGKTSGSYSYKVRACAGSGTGNCSAYSTTQTITVTLPPALPTLTVPSTSSTGSYSASWTTASGATHYELSEQVGAGSWSVIQDTSATSASLSGKTDGSYSYKVRACAGTGTGNCSAYSATGTITVTVPPPMPPVPTLTVPSTSNTGSYSASWTTSNGATHYELIERAGSGSWSVIQDTSATARSLSGKANGTYSYQVRACAGSGTGNCSGYSATSTITVTLPPAAPTLTVPSTSSTGSFSASWTTSSGATHYELSEQVGGGTWSVIQDTTATSKSLSGKADGSYSYKVRACSGTGTGNCSTYSSASTITVAIPPPPPPISGDFSKTEVITYHDNTALWVLGQTATVTCAAASPASTACDGDVASATTFDAATALPLTSSAFGKLQATATYASNGTLATIKDGNNRTTTYASWKRGIPQSIQFADATTRSATVDDNGWITSVTDETGALTCYGYDAMGRIASITYPSEASAGVCNTSTWAATVRSFVPVASIEYGIGAGHWRETVTTGNATKVTYYDGEWRPRLVREYDAAAVSATERFTATSYDAEGRVAFASYPSSSSAPATGVHTQYDALGRPTSVSQDSELGALTTTTAYGNGFITTVTDARGNATTTAYQAYDQPATGWPVLVAAPAGAYTHLVRDPLGKPTRIRRSNSASPTGGTLAIDRDYAYNANQELCGVAEPETGTTLMGYDAAGNLKWSASGLASQACEANGTSTAVAARRVDRTYDTRNRVSALVFPDLNGNQAWTYKPDGLPDTVTTYNDAGASSVVNSYTYNKRRLLTGESQASGGNTWAVGYGYDGNASLSTLVYPEPLTSSSSTLAYAPNALGQPTQAGSYASNVTYYPNGAIAGFTYGNGIVHSLTQNARGLPDRSKDVNGATSIHDDSYDYDPVGNVLAISDAVSGNRGNRDMTYDALNRLTQVTGTGGAASPMFGTAGYAYDVLDNLTHVQVSGGSQIRNQDYCYDSATNRLTNVKTGGCNGTSVIGLGYDVQGNLANKNGVLYGFDYGNRLRSGGPETYRYDVQGRRIRSSSSAGVVYSLYAQSGQLLFQRDERSSKRRQYIYLGGSLVAESDMPLTGSTATVTYQHTDALGTPVAITNSSRTVTERREYEPYGYQTTPALADGPNYTGHVADSATGLVYMQQRYYDPLCGCFVSTDPVGALSGPFNRYWYANANPYRFKDPDGRKCSTVDGKDSCTFDEFKDKKGNAITRDQALSSGSKLAKLLGVDRGSRILRAEAGMTAKYSAAKSLAANGGSVTIKGNESLGIPDQSVSGSAIVSQMETMPSVAAESLSPTNPREMASVPGVKSPLGTPSNGPITFWKDGSLTPNVPQVFGHEVLHTIYSGIGLANGGWANGAFNGQHQVPFNDASDQIK